MNKETTENKEQPEMPGTPEQEVQNAVASVLNNIDWEKVTKDDVFHDLMHNAKLFSFRLMVASALLEQLHLRQVAASAEAKPDNVVRFEDQESEPKS